MNLQSLRKRNGNLFMISSLKNLKNTKLPVNKVILLRFLMLYVTLPTFRWVTELCYMVLRIKYGQRISKFKGRICLRLVQAKRKHKLPWSLDQKNKRNRVTMKKLVDIILSIEHVIEKS